MSKAPVRVREEARKLFLTGELTTNREIAARLDLKAHTIGQWRRQEDWDGLRLKIDRRAAEMFVEKLATERVSLNLRHFKYWDVLMGRLAEAFKDPDTQQIKKLERLAAILERAQRGQRLARGLSLDGQTEEEVRAEAQTEMRRLVDLVIEVIKNNVQEETTRERIRRELLAGMPDAPGKRAG